MQSQLKVLSDGFITGLLLQLAIGPVFLYVISLSFQKTIYDGLIAVAAVTIVDYLYITMAICGVGSLLQNKKIKKLFGITSAAVLFVFGIVKVATIFQNTDINHAAYGDTSNVMNSFLSAFFLTISNPLTIVFWTSIFTAKSIERNYQIKSLIYFGISVGLATFFFMGSSVLLVMLFKTSISQVMVITLNVIIGFFLVVYSIVSFKKVFIS